MAEARSPALVRKRSPRVPAAEVILDADNPFPGPKPYVWDQRELFFGRGHETKELTALVLSTSAVLLYAQSGSGKSSLLQAGLVPSLEQRFRYRILPTVRFGRIGQALASGRPDASRPNPFAKLVCDTVLAADDQPEHEHDLERLAAHLGEQNGGAPTLLILDQFEELFANPALWRERGEFLAQLRHALDDHMWLRAVLAIRSDYLASLLPYERELPGRTLIRYELESLREQAARDAIEQTFRRTGVPLATKELDSVLDRLLSIETGPSGAHYRGQHVNLIQLQILCRRLWSEKSKPGSPETRGAPDGHDGSQVLQAPEVDLAAYMQAFVDDAVAAVAAQTRSDEGVVRHWLEDRLIISGRRAVQPVDSEQTAGLPQKVLDALENARLIQIEQRNQLQWAELTHDSMVAAVQAANDDWTSVRRRSRLLIAAALTLVLGLLLASFAHFLVPTDPTLLAKAAGIDTEPVLAIPFPPAPAGQVASVTLSLSGQTGAGATVRVVARDQGKNQDKALASSKVVTNSHDQVETTIRFVVPTVPSAAYAVVVDAPRKPADFPGARSFFRYNATVRSAPVIFDLRKPGPGKSAAVTSSLVAVKLYKNTPLYLRLGLFDLDSVFGAQTLAGNPADQVVIESPGGDGYALLSLSGPITGELPVTGEAEDKVFGQVVGPGPSLQLGRPVHIQGMAVSVSSVHVEPADAPFAVETTCQNNSFGSMALTSRTGSATISAASTAQSVPEDSVLVPAAHGSDYRLILLGNDDNLSCRVDLRSFARQRITATSVRKITIDANSRFNAYLVRLPADAAVIVTHLNGALASLDCLAGSVAESNSSRLLAFAPGNHDCVLSVARPSGQRPLPLAFPLLVVPVPGA